MNQSAWIRIAVVAFATVLGVSAATQAQEVPYEVKVNYSLAAENFKNGDFVAAMPYLRWLITNAPTVYNGERIHRRAVKAYEELADGTEDEALRAAYLDSSLILLRTAPTTLRDADAPFDENKWELDYGNWIIRHRHEIPGLDDEAVDHFLRTYELAPASLDPYYVRLIVQEYIRLEMPAETADFMDDAEQHFAPNAELMDFFDATRNELFKSPEERIAFLEGELAEEPGNIDLIRELFGIHRALENWAKTEEMGNQLLALDPSVSTYLELADIKNANADYGAAIDLYGQALDSAGDDSSLKRDIEYKIALAYFDQEQLQSSRTHARRALRHDAKFGKAYILIGDLLVRAVQESDFEREDRAVYWLAMDYFERAGSVDPDQRAIGRKKVRQYLEYMPTSEDKFFQGWNEGDSYPVNYGRYSWVNENTKVR